jgi:hypothetical protein
VLRAWRRAFACGAASTAAALCLAACGGSSGGATNVAVRVGNATITKAAVEHRVNVMMIGQRIPGHSKDATSKLKEQALSYLIAAQWVIQEAPSEWRGVSRQEVQQKLAEKERTAFPGGTPEFHEFLEQSGQAVADVRLEVEVELATDKLHEGIDLSLGPVTEAEAAAYYKRHRQDFGLPEMREVRIIDRKKWAEAAAVKRRVRGGVKFASISRIEKATGPNGTGGHPPSDALEVAIDAARPGKLVGPVQYRVDYFVFELKRLAPPRYLPFGHVGASITKLLTEQRQRRALARFVKEWRGRWRERTDCEPEYVVPKCMQYGGPNVAEDPLALN